MYSLRLPHPRVSFALLWLQAGIAAGLSTAVTGAAVAGEPEGSAANAGERLAAHASPRGPLRAPGGSLFHVGGLPLLEGSDYFSSEWYFDPAHSMERDVAEIDLTGQLARGLATGTLWEKSGTLPRFGSLEPERKTGDNPAPGCAVETDVPAGSPRMAAFCGLGLVGLLLRIARLPRPATDAV